MRFPALPGCSLANSHAFCRSLYFILIKLEDLPINFSLCGEGGDSNSSLGEADEHGDYLVSWSWSFGITLSFKLMFLELNVIMETVPQGEAFCIK